MEDKKLINLEAIRSRRARELRELALGVSYPLTHSGDAAHVKRLETPNLAVPSPRRRRSPADPSAAESVVEPTKTPANI